MSKVTSVGTTIAPGQLARTLLQPTTPSGRCVHVSVHALIVWDGLPVKSYYSDKTNMLLTVQHFQNYIWLHYENRPP